MMQRLLFCALFFPISSLQAITVVNECPNPVWAASAYIDSRSEVEVGYENKDMSSGWVRIGPYQQADIEHASYLRIERESDRVALTDLAPNAKMNVKNFCARKSPNNFRYEYMFEDGIGQNTTVENELAQCFKDGGRWLTFENMDPKWGKYTVYANTCNRQPDPAKIRTRYHQVYDSSGVTADFYQKQPRSGEWWSFAGGPPVKYREANPQNPDPKYILFSSPNQFAFAQGRVRARDGNGKWMDFGKGQWLLDSDDGPR